MGVFVLVELLGINDVMLREMYKSNTPGASLALIDKDISTSIYEGYGYRDLEQGLPSSPDTIYAIASITKVFTSVAIMKLVENGKLSLDDPAEKFIGIELRVKGKPVTIEHLLSHTSGIPAIAYAEALVSSLYHDTSMHPYTKRDVLVLLSKAAQKWAIAEPGEEFFYLNEGYVVLGYVIEKVSGLPYEEFISRFIAEPLGIKDIFFSPSVAKETGKLAYPYVTIDGKLRRIEPFSHAWSDGGLYTSAVEVLKLMQALAGISEVEIISKSTVNEMMKPRARMTSQLFGDDYYGLGLIVYNKFPLGRLVGHSGGLPGYRSYAGFVPQRKQALALLTNGEINATNTAMKILVVYNGANLDNLLFAVKERILDVVEGLYVGFEDNIKACVLRIGDVLLLESKEPKGMIKTILIPDEDDIRRASEVIRITSYRGGRTIQGRILLNNSSPVLIYERYKMVKSGTC